MAASGGFRRAGVYLSVCLLLGACGSSSTDADPSSTTADVGGDVDEASLSPMDLDGVESFEIAQDDDYILYVTPPGADLDLSARLRGSAEMRPTGVEIGDDRVVLAGDLCPLDDCDPRDLRVVVVDFDSRTPAITSLAAFDADGSVHAVAAHHDEAIVVHNQNGNGTLVGIDVDNGHQRRLDWQPESYDAAAIRAQASNSPESVIDIPRTTYCTAGGVLWAAASQGLGLSDEAITVTAVSIDLSTGTFTERGEQAADVRDYPDNECTDDELVLKGASGELAF